MLIVIRCLQLPPFARTRNGHWARAHNVATAQRPARTLLRLLRTCATVCCCFSWLGSAFCSGKSAGPITCRNSCNPLSVWQGKEAKPSAPTPHTVPPRNSCNAHAQKATAFKKKKKFDPNPRNPKPYIMNSPKRLAPTSSQTSSCARIQKQNFRNENSETIAKTSSNETTVALPPVPTQIS